MAVSVVKKTIPSKVTISVTSNADGGWILIPEEYRNRWINIYSMDYRYSVIMYSHAFGRVLKTDVINPTRADSVTFDITIVYI